MKANDDAASPRIEKLRQRLEKLDAERTAVAAELHRLTDPKTASATSPAMPGDPIAASETKDWHVFAGPARHKTRKPKAV